MDPKSLLLTCKPTFEELMKKYGNVGASVGILMDDNADYVGLGTVQTIPDEKTLYVLGILTSPL